jgi:hypothetical protein
VRREHVLVLGLIVIGLGWGCATGSRRISGSEKCPAASKPLLEVRSDMCTCPPLCVDMFCDPCLAELFVSGAAASSDVTLHLENIDQGKSSHVDLFGRTNRYGRLVRKPSISEKGVYRAHVVVAGRESNHKFFEWGCDTPRACCATMRLSVNDSMYCEGNTVAVTIQGADGLGMPQLEWEQREGTVWRQVSPSGLATMRNGPAGRVNTEWREPRAGMYRVKLFDCDGTLQDRALFEVLEAQDCRRGLRTSKKAGEP